MASRKQLKELGQTLTDAEVDQAESPGDEVPLIDHDGISQDDLQELFRAIRNGSDLTEQAECRILDALIDDDIRRRDEHKAVLDAILELRREVALLKVRLDDAHDDGREEDEWVPSGEVDYLEEPIMVRRPRR